MHIIYYYQTFNGLRNIIMQGKNANVTHIHLASIHFGMNPNKSPYIHLNDYPPTNPIFNNVWKELRQVQNNGIKIILMIGGGGGAYTQLFQNYPTYYQMLKQLLMSFPFDGVDLDVEDYCTLDQIQMFMKDIHTDFPHMTISMAPLIGSLITDEPGMGGFTYKDLWKSPEGALISYFNCQAYDTESFSLKSVQEIIKNGYPVEKIVMGMLVGQSMDYCLGVLKQIHTLGLNIAGAFCWEYFQAPPGAPTHPELWSELVKKTLTTTDTLSEI